MEPEKAGLPLESIFGGSSPKPEAIVEVASPEVKAEPEPKVESAPEAKPEAAEVKPEAAVEEKPPEKVEAKVEAKPAEEKKGEAPKFDWEAEGNPYKKRYEDTRDWATRVNGDAAETRRQLDIVNAKLDGTYDPAKFEKPAPTTAEIQSEAEIKGKIKGSEMAAYQMYGGKEKVEAELKEFNDQFGSNEAVQYRVLRSEAPIIEALKVNREAAFIKKWGTNPESIETAIRKDHETAMEAKLTEKITKQIMTNLQKKDGASPTLTNVRGVGDRGDNKSPAGPTPLTQIFS